MLKRSFRRVATIASIVEQNNNSARKTLKQVTFSTDLIYDILRKYEPNHVQLALVRSDAERELLDLDRLTDMILKFQHHIEFRDLPRPSPLSLPVILDVRTERLPGGGMEALLAQQSLAETAESLMPQVIGHFHPKLRTSLHGHRLTGKCFAVNKSLLIMPAFGSYTGGLDMRDPVFAGLSGGDPLRPYIIHGRTIAALDLFRSVRRSGQRPD